MITVTPLPAFNDNYLWMIDTPAQYTVVVDPGDGKVVQDWLVHTHKTLDAILITHHHHDHIGGIALLQQHYTVPVYGPDSAKIPQITHPLFEGDKLPIGDSYATVLSIPGHTLDHIAYYFEAEEALFCGDTLFAGGCGRLFDGSPQQLHHSLTRLAALPDSTQVYSAHEYTQSNLQFALAIEPDNAQLQQRIADVNHLRQQQRPTLPTTIAKEKQTNPFVRCHHDSVRQAVAQHWQQPYSSDESTFAHLRRWKDNF